MREGKRSLVQRSAAGLWIVVVTAMALLVPASSQAGDGPAGDRPNNPHPSWTTGNKLAVGTSANTDSKVWFTVAKGITTEVFYPRLDVPNMQDMQYIITDGANLVDLERDATTHEISMQDEKALEYTVVNTNKDHKYRITNTYITDPDRNTLLIRTRFQSLDGGIYHLYLLENVSMAGSGFRNDASWDAANRTLLSSGSLNSFDAPIVVHSALKVSSPNDFIAYDNGYSGEKSDCYQDLLQNKTLLKHFDSASGGDVVQCGEIGGIGSDTTFTVALGFGSDDASAVAAATGSLSVGFQDHEAAYRSGWNGYVDGLRPPPASVSGDTVLRRAYYVAAMALHAAEDKTFRGAAVAGFAVPWGDGREDADGYHRVWGRDLYQQATGLIAAGDFAQAKRMAQFMWNSQFIAGGSFPRYSPVSGITVTDHDQLGCCEQLDQNSFAILLAWMTGLTDATTYQKIKETADHIKNDGPDTKERWEEQDGKSPSSIAAEIAGLIAAADIARENGDNASANGWEAKADFFRSQLDLWTLTDQGYWGDHRYYERINRSGHPNQICPNDAKVCFDEGAFNAQDLTDFGFLDLVRLGVKSPDDDNIKRSLAPTASAFDGDTTVQVMINGDIYFRRYNHDNYGETDKCNGWPNGGAEKGVLHFGRPWPVLSGERGEYELANGRSAAVYLKSMADAANDGYFIPEQIWDKANAPCFTLGKPTGSAAPLNWAEGQYLRLAQSIDAGYNLETLSVVKAKYRGFGPIRGEGGKCIDVDANTEIAISTCSLPSTQSWTWDSGDGTLRILGKCLDVAGGNIASGTKVQLWDCNGTGAQQWRWRKQSRLVNPQSGRCLDLMDGNASGNAQLQLSDCNDSTTQAWRP